MVLYQLTNNISNILLFVRCHIAIQCYERACRTSTSFCGFHVGRRLLRRNFMQSLMQK